MDDRRKRAFLEALAAHGVARWAARAATPGCTSTRACEQTFRDERERDPAFAAAWARAQIVARERRSGRLAA